MIQQGTLDSVLWSCNTCLSAAQPVQPWSSPDALGIPHHLRRQHGCHHTHFKFMLELEDRRGRPPGRPDSRPAQEWIQNPQRCSAPGCWLHRPGARRRNRLRVGPPPIKCSVWRWAQVHLTISKFGRRQSLTHPFVITRYKTQAAALALSASLPWRSITDSQASPPTPKVRTHHITSQRHTHGIRSVSWLLHMGCVARSAPSVSPARRQARPDGTKKPHLAGDLGPLPVPVCAAMAAPHHNT